MPSPFPIDPERPHPHDVMKLAFAVWVSKLIADADGVLELSEIRLLTRAFPQDLLRAHGLTDADGHFTDVYRRAHRDAVRVLPDALSEEEKLDLVTVFHDVCLADDALVQAELLVLREAAEVLGLTVRQLSRHLARLKARGR